MKRIIKAKRSDSSNKAIRFNIEFDVQVPSSLTAMDVEDGLKLALIQYADAVGWLEGLVVKQGSDNPKGETPNQTK